MKAILTFATLLFIVATAVGSAFLYLNENYILSAALCIGSIISVALWIKSAGMNILNTEKHAQ
jgi:NhaP-type Na+/H+ or K+/H+ antiporter